MTAGARNLAHQIRTTKRTRKRSKFGKVLGFALMVLLAFSYPWVLLLVGFLMMERKAIR